ncbi:hypothetical protein EDD18DRAFT_193658 [Armillaria luteobubalina]|uniref:MYND-type domain-containing protein n=1 Tax=Armillaria luteobubalina TaxID=153913 RepID=A0AA39P169_9AGAR|nr:hypothetical protein EDD18DRAFT_193658 [Armillaria luteobubalina]
MQVCDEFRDVCSTCQGLSERKLPYCSRCKSFQYCSRSCQRAHWKAGHKEKCVESDTGILDRKYHAYLGERTILGYKDIVSGKISDYMKKFSITDRTLLAIQVNFRSKSVDFVVEKIMEIAGDISEVKLWSSGDYAGASDTCGMVRVLAPGGIDESHRFLEGWTIGIL